MKNQALKACFLYSPRLGENVVRPYNEVSVYMTFMLFIPNEAVMESFCLQKLSLTGCI